MRLLLIFILGILMGNAGLKAQSLDSLDQQLDNFEGNIAAALQKARKVEAKSLEAGLLQRQFEQQQNPQLLNQAFQIIVPQFKGTGALDYPTYQQVENGCLHNGLYLRLMDSKLHYLLKQNTNLEVGIKMVEDVDKMAMHFLNRAITQKEKSSYMNVLYHIYGHAQAICYSLYNKDQNTSYKETAFYFAEHFKSLLLKDALKENEALSFGQIPAELRKEYQQLRKEHAELERKSALLQGSKKADPSMVQSVVDELKQKVVALKALDEKLKQGYPKYYQLKNVRPNITIAELQTKILNDTSAYIDYVATNEHYYVFSVTANDFKWYRLPATEDLEETLKSFIRIMITPKEETLETYKERCYALYQTIMADVIKDLPKTTRRLIFVPDGKLHHLPFEVLIPNEAADASNFGALPYLIKDYIISYTYSAALLKENKAVEIEVMDSTHRLLAVAGMYDSDQPLTATRSGRAAAIRQALGPLPFARKEVESLSEVFKGKFLYENEAGEGSFKEIASDYSVIHLAMHGLADTKQPHYSGLAFTENGDENEDNILFLHEINNLNLKAELVVLSACETGIGKFQVGEGVVSVARSFMYANVPSVIMTLWPVSDQATKIIMTKFYENLKDGMTKDEALQRAQVDYMAEMDGIGAHPVFWAPYIQLGDNQPLKLKMTEEAIAKEEAEESEGMGSTLWFLIGGGAALLLLFVFVAFRRKK